MIHISRPQIQGGQALLTLSEMVPKRFSVVILAYFEAPRAMSQV